MPVYKLANGDSFEGPDVLTKEQQQYFDAQGGITKDDVSKLKDVGKAAWSGLKEGAMRAPFIGADLVGLGATLLEKVLPGTTSEKNRSSTSQYVLDTFGFEKYKPQTQAGRYSDTIANAVGGGLALPFGGALPLLKGIGNTAKNVVGTGVNIGHAPGVAPTLGAITSRGAQNPILQNTAIGAGTQLGNEVSSKGGTQSENPWLGAAGGASTALALALTARGTTPKFASGVSRSLEDMKPTDWQNALKVKGEMDTAGSTSYTAADLMPPTSRLRAVTQEMSNERGSGAIHDKLAGRADGEVARLLDEAKTGAQNAALPSGIQLPGGANLDEQIFQATRGNRSRATKAVLANGAPVPEQTVRQIAEELALKANPGRGIPRGQELAKDFPNGPSDIKYLEEASNTLRGVPTYPLPPPPALATPTVSPILQANGKPFPGPPPPAPLPQSPQFANLEALSKYIKELEMKDALTGGTAGELIKNKGAVSASSTASALLKNHSVDYSKAMDAYKASSPQVNIAELLAKNKLSSMPSQAAASFSEQQVRAQLVEFLARIDPTKATMFTNKLAAADRLSRLTPQQGAAGMQQELKQTMTGAVVTPFGTAARKAGLSSQLSANEQLSRLLANPTPENLKILEQLGRNNPDLVSKIREVSNLGAVSSAAQSE